MSLQTQAKSEKQILFSVIFYLLFKEFQKPIFLCLFIPLKVYITKEQFVFFSRSFCQRTIKFTNDDETCRWTLFGFADHYYFLLGWEHW